MTSATVRAPRPSGSGPAHIQKLLNLTSIQSQSPTLPNRFGMYAGIGFGKTSLFAHAPSPIFIMTKGETGLETLIGAGQLPPTPHFPEIETWVEFLAAIETLQREDHSYKSLVIDTGNGAEKMLHEHVCTRDFGGDWGDRGFAGYQRGYDVAMADWRMMLTSLDTLRRDRGMTIYMLFHSRVKTFKNPNGADYDRYSPEMHEKTWTLTKGWLDCILFGNIEVVVTGTKDTSKKGKATDTSQRVLCTNSDNPTYDAKNRFGLPDEIEMGESATEAWKNLRAALVASRKQPAAVSAEVSNG